MLYFLTISGYSLRVIKRYYQELPHHFCVVRVVHVYAWVCVYGGQRLIPLVFLSLFPSYSFFFETGSLTEHGAHRCY